MPIVNKNYVAPAWSNNTPPAIDAPELSAISMTLESNQRKIGDTLLTSRTNLGADYLLCNGDELSSSLYPDLYAALPVPSVLETYVNHSMIKMKNPPGHDYSTNMTISTASDTVYGNGYYVFTFAGMNNGDNFVAMAYTSNVTSGLWDTREINRNNSYGMVGNYSIVFKNGYFLISYISAYFSNPSTTYSNNVQYFSSPGGTISNSFDITSSSGASVACLSYVDNMWVAIYKARTNNVTIRYSTNQAPTGFLDGSSAGITAQEIPVQCIFKYGGKYYMATHYNDGVKWSSRGWETTNIITGQWTGSNSLVGPAPRLFVSNSYKYLIIGAGVNFGIYRSNIGDTNYMPLFGTYITSMSGGVTSDNKYYCFFVGQQTESSSLSKYIMLLEKSTDNFYVVDVMDIGKSQIISGAHLEDSYITFSTTEGVYSRHFDRKYLPYIDGIYQYQMIRAK